MKIFDECLSPAITNVTNCIESLETFLLFEPLLEEGPLEDFVSWYLNIINYSISILLLGHNFIPFSNQKKFLLEVKNQTESTSLMDCLAKLHSSCETLTNNMRFIQNWIRKALSKTNDESENEESSAMEKFKSLLTAISLALNKRANELIAVVSSKLENMFLEEDKITFFSTLIAYQQKQCQLLKSNLLLIQEDHIPSIIEKLWNFSDLFRKVTLFQNNQRTS